MDQRECTFRVARMSGSGFEGNLPAVRQRLDRNYLCATPGDRVRVRVQLIGHARNNMYVNLSHTWL